MEPYWYGGPRGSTSSDSQQYGYYNYGVSLVTSGSVQGPHLAHPQPVSSDRGQKYVYSLRVINPKRKSLFEFTSESQFQFPGELRSRMKEEFSMVATVYQEPDFWRTEGQELLHLCVTKIFRRLNPLQHMI